MMNHSGALVKCCVEKTNPSSRRCVNNTANPIKQALRPPQDCILSIRFSILKIKEIHVLLKIRRNSAVRKRDTVVRPVRLSGTIAAVIFTGRAVAKGGGGRTAGAVRPVAVQERG